MAAVRRANAHHAGHLLHKQNNNINEQQKGKKQTRHTNKQTNSHTEKKNKETTRIAGGAQ